MVANRDETGKPETANALSSRGCREVSHLGDRDLVQGRLRRRPCGSAARWAELLRHWAAQDNLIRASETLNTRAPQGSWMRADRWVAISFGLS